MKNITLLYRLASMRSDAGAGPVKSTKWPAGLLWRAR
ncbi:hypothetical protein ACDW_20130 [Acidovorax sp. DW039]|nr:hypothetical protein ACDW_20130 [Acidovorax sp. DW039]